MDAFDQAEAAQALSQMPAGRFDLPDGTQVNNNPTGATSVTELPPALPQRPQNMRIEQDAGGRMVQRAGADPFETAVVRRDMDEAIKRGDDLTPILQRSRKLGAYDGMGGEQQDAPMPAEEKTTVGDWTKGGVVNNVGRLQWEAMRQNYATKYPDQPMPVDLLAWQWFKLPDDEQKRLAAGEQTRLRYVREYGQGWQSLADPNQVAQLRQQFIAKYPGHDVPDIFQGTIQEREAADAAATMQGIRVRARPEYANLPDEQLLAALEQNEAAVMMPGATFERGFLSELASALARGNEKVYKVVLGGGAGLSASGAEMVGWDGAGRYLRGVETNYNDYYGNYGADSESLRPSDEAAKPYNFGSWRWWVSNTAESVPGMGYSWGLAALAKAAALAYGATRLVAGILANTTVFGATASQEAGAAYAEIRDGLLAQGIDSTTANHRAAGTAAVVGVANGLLEVIPFHQLASNRAVKKSLWRVAEKCVAEGADNPQAAMRVLAAEMRKPKSILAEAFYRQAMQQQEGAAARIGKTALLEGFTEYLQEGDTYLGGQAAGVKGSPAREVIARMVGAGLIGTVLGGGAEVTSAHGGQIVDAAVRHGGEAVRNAAQEVGAAAGAYGEAAQYGAGKVREGVDKAATYAGEKAAAAKAKIGEGIENVAGRLRREVKFSPAGQQSAYITGADRADIGVELPEDYVPSQPPAKGELARRDALAQTREMLDEHAPKDANGRRRFPMPYLEGVLGEVQSNRKRVEDLTQEGSAGEKILGAGEQWENEKAARKARWGKVQGIEGREVPPVPANLGEPQWKPKLSSMTAAKGRAAGMLGEGVTFGRTQQLAVNQILDGGEAGDTGMKVFKRKLQPGENSQADSVPPIVVRKLANGGYQVLDGADQLAAAKSHGFRQVPVIVANGAADPRAAKAKPAGKPAPTGTAPRRLTRAESAGMKAGLVKGVKGGEIIHGTDARNLKFIVKQGLAASGLSGVVDAEQVPAGGFGKDIPSTAASYAAGRAQEMPILLVLKKSTNRGVSKDGLVNSVAATSEGKSYVAASDIEAVVFPDGKRLPLAEAVKYYERVVVPQRQAKLVDESAKPTKPADSAEADAKTSPPAKEKDTKAVQQDEGNRDEGDWDFTDTFPPLRPEATNATLDAHGIENPNDPEEMQAIHESAIGKLEHEFEFGDTESFDAILDDYAELFGEEGRAAIKSLFDGKVPEKKGGTHGTDQEQQGSNLQDGQTAHGNAAQSDSDVEKADEPQGEVTSDNGGRESTPPTTTDDGGQPAGQSTALSEALKELALSGSARLGDYSVRVVTSPGADPRKMRYLVASVRDGDRNYHGKDVDGVTRDLTMEEAHALAADLLRAEDAGNHKETAVILPWNTGGFMDDKKYLAARAAWKSQVDAFAPDRKEIDDAQQRMWDARDAAEKRYWQAVEDAIAGGATAPDYVVTGLKDYRKQQSRKDGKTPPVAGDASETKQVPAHVEKAMRDVLKWLAVQADHVQAVLVSGGELRYDEVRDALLSQVKQRLGDVEEFRVLAKQKGFDAESLISEWGGIPEQWADPRDSKAKDAEIDEINSLIMSGPGTPSAIQKALRKYDNRILRGLANHVGSRDYRHHIEAIFQSRADGDGGIADENEQSPPAQPPSRPSVPTLTGKATTIHTAEGEPIPAKYALIEAADLKPSHRATSFLPTEGYPPGLNERDYQHDKTEQAKVHRQVNAFDPAFVLTDNPDPVNGPPMILANGWVMGGNSRAMSIHGVYDNMKKGGGDLRTKTLEAAERFGVNGGEKMKKPVLVRVLDEASPELPRMRELVRLLQKGRTQELSGAMDAASRARILMDNPDSLERLENLLGDADSIREVMSDPKDVLSLRDWLTSSGVLTASEHARYTNSESGMLNEDGKRLIERILQAIVVPDPGLFDSLPANVANKVTGNLFGLVLGRAKGEKWDLSASVTNALRAWYRWRQSKAPLEAWMRGEDEGGQSLMTRDPILDDARAIRILDRLVNDNAAAWRERIKQYVTHVRAFIPGEITFGFATHTQADPDKAFKEVFGRDIPRDLAGNEPVDKKAAKAGGSLFMVGPQKYYNAIDDLRDMFQWPERMSAPLRRALRLPRRKQQGLGPVFMVTGGDAGPRPIDAPALLNDPATAERLMRIGTFHLEQHADAGDNLLPRWKAGVSGDLGSILRDLGYQSEADGMDGLLGKMWGTLAADADVIDALGDLPAYDAKGEGAESQGEGAESQGGKGAESQGGKGAESQGGKGAGDDVPAWVPISQKEAYRDALGSDRVSPYVPLPPTRSGHHHPRLLVESKALSGVSTRQYDNYETDPRAIEGVSDAQRDQATAAGWRIHHANAGALIADDVGVGKSRVMGAIIADQMFRAKSGLSGKRRVLVLTKNRQNIADLQRTFNEEMQSTFDSLKKETGVKMYSLPDMTAGERSWVRDWHSTDDFRVLFLDTHNFVKHLPDATAFKPDLVMVDEAHLFGNLESAQRAGGLQTLFESRNMPDTHWIYLTATPASSIESLQFMYGLGLWQTEKMAKEAGADGGLPTFDQWLQANMGVTKAGSWRESIATPIIEQLVRELKMDGAYHSLDFWRGGFEFEMAEASIDAGQTALYDSVASVLNEALRLYAWAKPQVNHGKWPQADGSMKAPPRPDGQAIFLVKRLLVEFRKAAAIGAAKKALANGEQVVFKILGTSDTLLTGDGGNFGAVFDAIPLKRAVKNKRGEIIDWVDIENDNGSLRHAVSELRSRVGGLTGRHVSISPLTTIIEEFGENNVAAIVGDTDAKMRVVHNADFQSGKRKVAVISAAGTTGINMQDLGTGRRKMIVLDLDWDSKEFKQSLGRVDRANQTTSPSTLTIYTPIAGERKFQATIAARMRSLGAISKGQSDSGAEQEALADFDMESSTWHRAINETVMGLPQSQKDLLLRAVKLEAGKDLSWKDFQNDLMLLPVAAGNAIYDKAYARWRELEGIEAEKTGGKVARRNRGMIRDTIQLDESLEMPLDIHTVESVTGETYGILSGKLLTRSKEAVALPVIQDVVHGKNASQMQRNHYVTMQQGDKVVSGLYVPRGRIERVKALFGKAAQSELIGKDNPATDLPDEVIEKLPPRLAMRVTKPHIPASVLQKKHRKGLRRVSRRDITDQVIHRLRLSVSVGKHNLLRRKALGFYWNKAVRLRTANDIAVLAHEVGHGLDDLLTGLNPPLNFDHELLPLGRRTSRASYSQKQVRMEGVAEWFRMYMIDPNNAASVAPGYTAWFEKAILAHPTVHQAVRELQGLYESYLAQDAVDRFKSQIDFDDDGPSVRSPLAMQSRRRQLYAKTVDNRAPLNWMRQDVTGSTSPFPEKFSDDPYTLSRLLPGGRDRVAGWWMFGVRDRSGKLLCKGGEQVLQENGIRARHIEDFETYLVAVRANELYAQAAAGLRELRSTDTEYGGALGVTWNDAKAVIAKLETPAFMAAARGVHTWGRAVLDFYKTTGFFNNRELELIQMMNQMHVPMHRVRDNDAVVSSLSNGLVDKGRQLFRIYGSDRLIKRPLATLIENTAFVMDNIEGNRVIIKAMEMLDKNKDYRWAEPVSRPLGVTTANLREIKADLIRAGAPPSWFEEQNGQPPQVDLDVAFKLFRPIRHKPAEGVVAYRRNGKHMERQIHVPMLYDSITGSHASPTNNPLLRLLVAGKNLSWMAFTHSIGFVFSNSQRDQQTAWVQSRYGYVPWVDFTRGFYAILRENETYQLWLNSGGSSANRLSRSTDSLKKITRKLGKSRLRNTLENLNPFNPGRWLDAFEALSNIAENASRVGEFRKALTVEGVNEEGLARAGMASRDLTVDFWRGGEWTRELGQWKVFLGAKVQGIDYVLRYMFGRGGNQSRKALPGSGERRPNSMWRNAANTWAKAMMLAFWGMAMVVLKGDNPDYDERKRERKTYWLVPKGDPETTTEWIRLRKADGWTTVFSDVGEAIAEAMLKHDPAILKELFPDKQSAASFLLYFAPTAIENELEAAMNWDSFRDAPVVPRSMENVKPGLQFTRYTSDTAKLIGEKTNISPIIIDHLAYGRFGTLGRETIKLVDRFVTRPALGLAGNPHPSRGAMEDVPGLNILFSRDLSASQSSSVNRLWDDLDDLKEVKRTINYLEGQPIKQAEYRDKNADILRRSELLEAAERQMKDFRDQMALIYDDQTYTPDEKRKLLIQIESQMIDMARQVEGKSAYPVRPAFPVE